MDTAYVHVAGRVGGIVLFQVVNVTLLVATIGSGRARRLAAARLLYGMGRDNTIPRALFRRARSEDRASRATTSCSPARSSLVGAFLMSYQLGAELLNFGAFIAFMGVNAATFVHYWVRGRDRSWSHLVPPLAGFLICLYIWLSLRTPAKIAGAIWLAIGIAYGGGRPKDSSPSW